MLARSRPGFRAPLPSRPAAVATCLLLASCSTTKRVEIDEKDVFSGGLRVELPVAHEERLHALRAGELGSAVGWHNRVELELDFTADEAEQTIGPGDVVELEEVPLVGPGTIEYDYDVWTANLSWVRGSVSSNGLLFDLSLGLNATQVGLEAELGGARESLRSRSLGPHFGAQLGWLTPWRLIPRLRAGYSAEAPLDSTSDIVETSAVELGLLAPLGRWLALDGGWRWRNIDSERSGSSDLALDLEGLFVRLALAPF